MNLGKMQAGLIMLVGYALRALSPPYTYNGLQRLGHVAMCPYGNVISSWKDVIPTEARIQIIIEVKASRQPSLQDHIGFIAKKSSTKDDWFHEIHFHKKGGINTIVS